MAGGGGGGGGGGVAFDEVSVPLSLSPVFLSSSPRTRFLPLAIGSQGRGGGRGDCREGEGGNDESWYVTVKSLIHLQSKQPMATHYPAEISLWDGQVCARALASLTASCTPPGTSGRAQREERGDVVSQSIQPHRSTLEPPRHGLWAADLSKQHTSHKSRPRDSIGRTDGRTSALPFPRFS